MVRLADKIAYINHDIEDALRGGVIYPIDIPLEVSQVLGFTHGERINALVEDVITASRDQDAICQSPEVGEAMASLREFMFESVYTNPLAKGEEGKAQEMLRRLFEHYQKNPDELPPDFQEIRLEESVDRAVCDYIAGMTDVYALEKGRRWGPIADGARAARTSVFAAGGNLGVGRIHFARAFKIKRAPTGPAPWESA